MAEKKKSYNFLIFEKSIITPFIYLDNAFSIVKMLFLPFMFSSLEIDFANFQAKDKAAELKQITVMEGALLVNRFNCY